MINSNLISQLSTQNTDALQNVQNDKNERRKGLLSDSKLDKHSRVKIENLIDKILIGIRENQTPSILLNKQATKLNISNNLAKDLQDLKNVLKTLIKQEPLLEKEFLILDKILKPMQTMDGKQIKQAFLNSGIFLESKLKEGLRNEKLPPSFHKLVSFMKGIKSSVLKEKFIALSQYEMDAKTSVEELKKAIKDIPPKNYDGIKTLDRFSTFLQNIKQFLALNRDKNPKSVLNASNAIIKHINTIKLELNKELKSFVAGADEPSSKRSLLMLSNSLNKLANTILKLHTAQTISSSHNKLAILQTLQSTPNKQLVGQNFNLSKEVLALKPEQNINGIFNDDEFINLLKNESLNLQNQTSSLSRLLKQNMQIFKENKFENISLHKEAARLDSLIKKAQSDSDKITPKTDDEVINELKDDAKAMLLNINSKTNNENVLGITNRLLTQIELNQLMSVANNSLNMYLPYAWEDLEHSSIVFKRGSDDKYYAQIKLEFEKLGKIHIFLNMWDEKYLDINIMVSDDRFRMLLANHGKELKNSLKDKGILCSGFFIQRLKETTIYEEFVNTNVGLDVKA